ncbi:Rho GDP-dissociation inhibitor 1 [Trichoplax sp. H2]|uniref:Rho GDP-dissociation inhibitor 3 n=1 Tax=Trichoplax adhaerens TaxID=10228 RepID=B3RMN3_TRIAD|nr:expressed hypothetical protein [Trichoplax adhaerens]EDV27880.1 expressed hypothetical protein [Trichoplax adhaerens]RDD43971.1 Rho GDP-dissociation inhibitor 1 [Trichoplax sp. H2]|eukprot:XP_002109714.1 expressed hypothetical protein [Trichoplax adhaerens]
MAEQEEADIAPEETPGYKAPEMKSIEEIQNLDKEDESLVRYKQALLGAAAAGGNVGDSSDPRKVIVQKISLVVEGRDDFSLDLTGDISKLKERAITIKEGCEYRIKISFKIQHEIVSGLKYMQVVSRKGIRVDKSSYMVGSYGPSPNSHHYTTPVEEAPKGMLSRGHYSVKSKFTDDDKNIYLSWEWSFDIKKDWN